MNLRQSVTASVKQMAGYAVLIAAFGILFAGCDGNQERAIKIIDAPAQSKNDEIALERADRLEGLYAYDWMSDQELLGSERALSNALLVVHRLPTGDTLPTDIPASSQVHISPDRKHAVVLRIGKAEMLELGAQSSLSSSGRSIEVGGEGLSYLLNQSHGSWKDNSTYIVPVVNPQNEYGLALLGTDGGITYLSVPASKESIEKIEMRDNIFYMLNVSKQLLRFELGSKEAAVMYEHIADFSLSPDGQQLAIVVETAVDEEALKVVSTADVTSSTFVAKGRLLRQPSWSPDGTKLAFTVFNLNQGMTGLYVMNAKTGRMAPIAAQPNPEAPILWSPSGRQLMVSEEGAYDRSRQSITTLYQLNK
ncbi:TolB family protein [Paenibacillus sp. UNC451MF]|uniref:TolB family protein n=1 Tax=Paenibacillus sp. UNC451MF TaxID=1449063 RepID=UPI00048B332B|nr:LpqB family beta-propeller domain-containing protein [Paenibacillus sp. UNC451MF]